MLRHGHRLARRGITVIELVVVVVIMAVAAGMVIGTLAGQEPYFQIRQSARSVAGMMELARQQSAITGNLVRIVYDFDEQRAWLEIPRELEEGEYAEDFHPDDLMISRSFLSFGRPGRRDASIVWLDSVQTYDGRTYSRGQLVIDVRPIGASIGHIVHLASRDNEEEHSIQLNPLTGVAYISQERQRLSEPVRD